jgi:hypothetical protein
MQFREIVAAGLSNPTFEDKRRWLEILQVTVTVKNRQAVIACRLPVDPLTVDLAGLVGGNGGGTGTGGEGLPFDLHTSEGAESRFLRDARAGQRGDAFGFLEELYKG